MWLTQLDGLHSAPISKDRTRRVVDIGCGTGVWTTAFALQQPDAQVLGIDITLPHAESAPRNCRFALADAEGDWAFAVQPFDFIFGRMLVNSIRDWPRFMARCLRNLQPGGWLELEDVAHRFFAEDGCAEGESPMLRWWRMVFQASSKSNGIDVDETYRHGQLMCDAGFANVREEVFKWRVGGSGAMTEKDRAIGDLLYANLQALIPGVTATAIRHQDLLGMTQGEAQALAEDAKRDLAENASKHGYYMHFAACVGQAPG